MDYVLFQLLISGLTIGSIIAMVGLAFQIIYNTTNIINFAVGEFVVLGSLFLYTFHVINQLDLTFSIVLALLLVGLCGILFERLFVFPFYGTPRHVPLIVTLGASFGIRGIMYLVWGTEPRFVPPFSGVSLTNIWGINIPTQAFWIFPFAVLTLILIFSFFRYFSLGKICEAVAVSERGAKVIGINVFQVSLLAFLLGSILAGFAGIMAAPITTAKYDLGLAFSLKGLTAAMFGGINNPRGVVFAGLIVGLLEAFLGFILPSVFREVFIYVIIIVILVTRPNGIWGRTTLRRV